MDKAETVFQKYAGVWGSIVKTFKKTTKLPKYEGPIKIQPTPRMNKVNKMYSGKGTAAQVLREKHMSAELVTGGKLPVSVLNKKELAKNVVRDRYLKSLGM